MPQSMVQPDHNRCLQDFHRWVKENSICHTGRPANPDDPAFLPDDRLSTYLESNDHHNLSNLLVAIYENEAIEIKFLERFVEWDDLKDTHLPFTPNNPPNHFPIDSNCPDFFKRFCKAQWRFCAPELVFTFNRNLDKDCVMPFTSKTLITEGDSANSARIYKIELHVKYNGLPNLGTTDPPDLSTNIFALKTYCGREAEKTWNNEITAFKKLRIGNTQSPNVIGFYSSFTLGETHSIILEYADKGSLEQYLQNTRPPVGLKDTTRFWRGIFGLLRGLKDMHHGQDIVWHQDLKPANILVLSSSSTAISQYNCKFKIADFGTSHSKRMDPSDSDDTDQDAQGTRTYGAPECYRSDDELGQGNIRVTTKVDIWSIGCILSEIVTWIEGGCDGLATYRHKRRAELQRITDFHDGDCFHDGDKVLTSVREWHNTVWEKLKHDPTSLEVLHMAEEMLQDATVRPDANYFCKQSHNILTKAFENLGKAVAHSEIEDDLLLPSMQQQRQRTEPSTRPPEFDVPARSSTDYHRNSAADISILSAASASSPETVHSRHSESDSPFLNTSSPRSATGAYGFHTSGSVADSPLSGTQSRIPHRSRVAPVSQHTMPSTSPVILEGSRQSTAQVGSILGGHRVTSAPVEFTRPFSIVEGLSNRRYSEQPPVYEPSPNSDINHRMSRHSNLEEEVNPFTSSFAVGLQPNPNINMTAAGHAVFHSVPLSNPASPPTPIMSPLVRPSTCLPLKVPPVSNTVEQTATHTASRHRSDSIVPPLTIDDACAWRDAKKQILGSSAPLSGEWALATLHGRDSIFIVDDAESMRQHWPEVKKVFGILAYMVKTFDPDGLDLYFTQSPEKHHHKHTKYLVNIVDKRMDNLEKGRSDISIRLDAILNAHIAQLRRPLAIHHPLNVYILTDGIWTPSCNIVPAIDKTVNMMVELSLRKQVGLQFISFGTDPEGLARMELVDNRLGLPHDIVDTTPSNGNPYKMLRGAIDKDFDTHSHE